MCTGASMFMLAASAFKAVSAIQEGKQQQAFYNYQSEQQAADANAEREAGQVRAEKARKAGRYQQSEARASLAASGVEVSAGTPEKIQTAITRTTEEDALQEILYGNRKGTRLDQESALSREAGKRAVTTSQRSAFGSLLAGGAAVKGGWTQAPAPVEDRYWSIG